MVFERIAAASIAAILLTVGSAQAAPVVTLLSNSNHNPNTAVMDANLGITGLTIESFEDVNLAPGLTVEHTNPNGGPTGTLNAVYTDGSGFFNNNSWDGPGALVNTFNNIVWFPAPGSLSDLASRVTFHLAAPVATFGVGLGNFQAGLVDHAVLVNGVELVSAIENMTNFTDGINLRNGYLLVQAGAGESITSVAIESRVNGTTTPATGADGLIFDRLAFGGTPIPAEVSAPGAVGILGAGLVALGAARRRRPAV